MARTENETRDGGRRWFPTTHWSVVVAAGDHGNRERQDALAALCRTYWPPVYTYVRRRGHDPEGARDLTQGFFTGLLEKNGLGRADRERGKFRSFLLVSLKSYMSHERERANALRRGGGESPIPLDLRTAESFVPNEPADLETPESLFEKRWALTLLRHAMLRLENEMASAGRRERFKRFRPFLSSTTAPGPAYSDVARDLGMTGQAVKVAVHRTRKRFGALLRDEVTRTVADPERVDEELRYLIDRLTW